MAHHKSAKTRIRRNAHRTDINRNRISRIRTFIRRVEEALATGDSTKAKDALRKAQPEIMRGVTKGVLQRNTAARKMRRLSARIKAMKQAA